MNFHNNSNNNNYIIKTNLNTINVRDPPLRDIYSKYSMVDIETVIYFFSRDISKKQLYELFSVQKDNKISGDTNNNPPPNKRYLSTTYKKLIKYIDHKYQDDNSSNINTGTKNNIYKSIKSIHYNYYNKYYHKKNFCGWDYYKENETFLKSFFFDDHEEEKQNKYFLKNKLSIHQQSNIKPRPSIIIPKHTVLTPNATPPLDPSNIIIKTISLDHSPKGFTNVKNTKKICLFNDNNISNNTSYNTSDNTSDNTSYNTSDNMSNTSHNSVNFSKPHLNNLITKNSTSINKYKNNLNMYIKKDRDLKTHVYINSIIHTINDLLILINKYPMLPNVVYNINMEALHKISIPLARLNAMIGLKCLKNNIVDQILYFLQNFHTVGKTYNDYMHTVIYGPPGTGKTEIAKIIGEIFSKLGILKNNIFKKVTRADLIAGYLGQTAIKTKNIINECIGGVLFIDEAYALGNTEKGDSFSKECIDTLCESLSDNKDNLMVIIAGYKNELHDCFFSYNKGLESRFAWRYDTDHYTPRELNSIFRKKIYDAGWTLYQPIPDHWFKKNYKYFKSFGRDIETLFTKIKIRHSNRVFGQPLEYRTKITLEDVNNGFRLYLINNTDVDLSNTVEHMYI